MKSYQVISKGKGLKDFILLHNDVVLAELKYSKWYSSTPDVIFPDDTLYSFKIKSIWKSTSELVKDGEPFMFIKDKWNCITIKSLKQHHELYQIKNRSAFGQGLKLINYNNKQLAMLNTHFKWKKFGFDYEMVSEDDFGITQNEQLLLILMLFVYQEQIYSFTW